MLLVISPAKNLDETPVPATDAATRPAFVQESAALATKLATLSQPRLQRLMGISKPLAELNHGRFQTWAEAPLKPAVLLYNGEVYRGLDAPSLKQDDRRFAQRHLRILSGLYGVLRPDDLIAPHRLEMGTKLSMGRGKKDLYAFWGDRITEEMNATLRKNREHVMVNLASAEYFKSIRPALLEARVVTPAFKERSAKGLRSVAVFAKHQRGAMARWAIKHRILEPEALKRYDGDGYHFQAEGSTDDEWLFVRDARVRGNLAPPAVHG